jgi:hypothetical protein
VNGVIGERDMDECPVDVAMVDGEKKVCIGEGVEPICEMTVNCF